MANEIKFTYSTGKTTLVATIFNTTNAWSTSFGGNWAAYAQTDPTQQITLVELQGPTPGDKESGLYYGDLDDFKGDAGEYQIVIRDTADHQPLERQTLYWDGTQEVPAAAWELAQTSLDYKDETAVATDMLGAIAQLWRRFFNKVDKTTDTITTYNSNDTAATEQTYSEGDTTDVVGKASSVP